jgi:hypothetical protein
LNRHNGTGPSHLKGDLLDKLEVRLREPPPDGGVWSSRKVADFVAPELGLDKLTPQRGWEALKAIGWVNPVATLEEPVSGDAGGGSGLKRTRRPTCRGSGKASRQANRGLATDEHRLGLEPIHRRIWASIGERPSRSAIIATTGSMSHRFRGARQRGNRLVPPEWGQ